VTVLAILRVAPLRPTISAWHSNHQAAANHQATGKDGDEEEEEEDEP
jgi:hypothetical protein